MTEAEPHVARPSLTRSKFNAILVVLLLLHLPSSFLLLFVFLRSHSPLLKLLLMLSVCPSSPQLLLY